MTPREVIKNLPIPDVPLQPRPPMYIDLSFLREGEEIINIQTYRVETKKPRKWMFWQRQKIKFNFMALTNYRRVYIIDPDALTVHEKANQ